MIEQEDYIKTGQILRTYGISGALAISVELNYNPFEHARIDFMFVAIDGSFVPFHILNSEPGPSGRWIIYLEDIPDPGKASFLCKRSYYIHKSYFPSIWPTRFPVQRIEGFTIVDIHRGKLGEVQRLGGTPDNPLVIFDFQNMEVLLPINEHFIKNIDFNNKSIKTDIPDDLLFLNQ